MRPTARVALGLAGALALMTAGAGIAQEPPRDDAGGSMATRSGWSARAGVGFTADPDTFLLNFELPYDVAPWVAVGPMLQLGLKDDYTIAAPSLNATVKPPLSGPLERLMPYGFAGVGLAVIDDDDEPRDDTDAGFMIDVGAGLEYRLTERVFVGTQVMFDFLPDETNGQEFIFGWQIAGLRYAF